MARHRRRPRRGVAATVLIVALVAILLRWGNDGLAALQASAPSESRGTPERGAIVNSRRLPTKGPNFVAYSYVGALLGRNSVHSAVRATILDAYRALSASAPDVQWVYGETGWPSGGPFPPHRSHQNGLSVDFFVPVRNDVGRSERVAAWPWTEFGYALNFDTSGKGTGAARGQHIDFPALAAHLSALAAAAPRHGLAIDLVIFAPELQRQLFALPEGAALRSRLRFMPRPAWVRHDEHYHVNFRVTKPALSH